jgi:hypothetical protein
VRRESGPTDRGNGQRRNVHREGRTVRLQRHPPARSSIWLSHDARRDRKARTLGWM